MRKLTLVAATALTLLAGSGRQGPSGADLAWPTITPAAAEEEDPEITSQAKLHFKLGQEAYAAGKYDQAIKELKRAYVLKRIPAILVNIAMTYRKTKDYEMAVYFYRKFLAEVPADDKGRAKVESEIAEVEQERNAANQPQQLEPAKPAVEMAKPAVDPTKMMPEATKPGADAAKPATDAAKAAPAGDATQAKVAPKPAEGAAPAEAAAPAPVADKPSTEWAHTPIDAVPPGQPVDVRVNMPVMKGVKVKVFYRKEGQANFESIELKRRGNEKVARLPESVAQGRTFQYYVEARDAAGTMVKSSGSEFSPNIVLIDSTARPQLVDATGVTESNDEDEPARRSKAGPKRDIENEAVSFDIGQQSAMERLRAQLRSQDRRSAKDKKSPLSAIGWAGVGVGAAGVAAMAGGFAFLGLAARDAAIVTADSRCENAKMKCLFFGPNDDPTLSKAANPPSSDYERQGMMYDKVGTALAAVGGVVLAAGGGLLAYDLIKKSMADRPAAPKKRKVKKVIEVEESTSMLLPVAGPNGVGFVGEIHF